MKYLILIHSPVQVINVYEFIKQKNVSDNDYEIIFISTSYIHVDSYIKKLIKKFLKEKFIFEKFQISYLNSLFNFKRKLKYYYNKYSKFDFILFANINNLTIRYFINNLNIKKILYDDGTSTLNYFYYKKKHLQINENTNFYSKFKYLLTNLFFNLNYKLPNVEYIFTIFDKIENNNIQYNNLKNFKNKYILPNFKYLDKTFFIGQPLYINGPINFSNYKKILKKIINEFNDSEFIYVIHRNESNQIIKFLNLNKIKFLILDEIFEMYLVNNKILPKNIVSITSTTLITCNLIFNNDNKINIFKIELEEKFFNGKQSFLNIDKLIKQYIGKDKFIKI